MSDKPILMHNYPDGTSYFRTDDAKKSEIVWRIQNYEQLWQLAQYVDAFRQYDSMNRRKLQVTLPRLIDAQADSRFGRYSYSLKIVLDFLNSLDVDIYVIYHPHNPQAVEMGLNNVAILKNYTFIEKVLQDLAINVYHLPAEWVHDHYITTVNERLYPLVHLLAADAGGYKPLMDTVKRLRWGGKVHSASKSRVDGKLHQILSVNDFKGKDVLIVDDICVYGGTFKGLAKLLRERNAGRLFLAVSHMTVQNLGKDSVVRYFDRVYTTNSTYDYYMHVVDEDGTIEEKPDNLNVIELFNPDNR